MLLDVLAAVCELGGAWAIGNRRRFGFVLNILGNICWIIVAIGLRLGLFETADGLILVCSILLIVNVRNYNKWRKEDGKTWRT